MAFYNNLADAQNEANPIANTTIAPSVDTNYFVVSTSAENCKSAIETIKITVNSKPVITTTDTSICEGDNPLIFKGLVGPASTPNLEFYNNLADAQGESNPITNTTISPSVDTNYFVVSTSAENCKSAIETIKITRQ